MVYWDKRTRKIRKSVLYKKYLQGLKLQQKLKVKEARRNLVKRIISKTPAGSVVEIIETARDLAVILKKGKIQ